MKTDVFLERLLTVMIALVLSTPAEAQEVGGSPFDFDQLSSTVDADAVDYHSGNWSYNIPLTTVRGAGSMKLPINIKYSSAITGLDRLTKLSTTSEGTHTVNKSGWVGLGWHLDFGAVVVTGGYNSTTNGTQQQHPYALNMSLILPDGTHALVRQVSDDGQPTNTFYAEKRQFWSITMDYDANEPLFSRFQAYSPDGTLYRFGLQPSLSGDSYGFNATTESARPSMAGPYPVVTPQMSEFVYRWEIAEIVSPDGNFVRFYYDQDHAVATTFRSTQEEFLSVNTFTNYLMVPDLDPFVDPTAVGDIEVIKTFHTAHLSEIRLFDSNGELVNTVEFDGTSRADLPLSNVTVDSLRQVAANGDYSLFSHLRQNVLRTPFFFRSLDGIATSMKLKSIVVRNADRAQVSRFDFLYGNVTVPSPVDGYLTHTVPVLNEVSIQGTDALSTIPSYRFEYSEPDSYRLSSFQIPTGAVVSVGYEPYPDISNTNLVHIEDGMQAMSRRIAWIEVDEDDDVSTENGRREFLYPSVDIWYRDTTTFVDALTHPVVVEVQPGEYGKIVRRYIGKSYLESMGFVDSLTIQGKMDRAIRRGTLLSEISYSESGVEVKRVESNWSFTPVGSYNGYTWFGSHGIRGQSFWIRRDEVHTVLDGVSSRIRYEYNPVSGLVNKEIDGDSVVLTGAAGDEETSPVDLNWVVESVDLANSYNDYSYEVADGQLRVSARTTGYLGVNPESAGWITFEASSFTADKAIYRISGRAGIDSVSPGNIHANASAMVFIDWSNGSREIIYLPDNLYQDFTDYSDPIVTADYFDKLIVVPQDSDVMTGTLKIQLKAYVHKPVQTYERYLSAFVDQLAISGIDFAQYDDPEYPSMVAAHRLTSLKFRRLQDDSGQNLRYVEYRYGNFDGRYLPDSTVVWLDKNHDNEILDDTDERIVRTRIGSYDAAGNPIESIDATGLLSSTIYGYRGQVPIAEFSGAHRGQVVASVFDEFSDIAALEASDPAWSRSGNGPVNLIEGVLVVHNGKIERSLPALTEGVLELDAMLDNETGDEGAIMLTSNGQPMAGLRFGSDGRFHAFSNGSFTPVNQAYQKHQWYHLRIQWNQIDGTWQAELDGASLPHTGTFQMSSNSVNGLVLEDTIAAGRLYVDRVRVYPSGSRATSMLTYDPMTLAVIEMTDENGVTIYQERDGFGRLIRNRDSSRRLLTQRADHFSRTGIGTNDSYQPYSPNQSIVTHFPSESGHKDLQAGNDLILSNETSETGNILETGIRILSGVSYQVATGALVSWSARDAIHLRPGFRAESGSEFHASLDPSISGASTGDVEFQAMIMGESAVRMGAYSSLDLGSTGGNRFTARLDFLATGSTSGTPEILRLSDDTYSVVVRLDSGSNTFGISLVRQNEPPEVYQVSTVGIGPYIWYTCEVDVDLNGVGSVWIFPADQQPDPTLATELVGLPESWFPSISSSVDVGELYLANVYVGLVERSVGFLDGAGRLLQSMKATDQNAMVRTFEYDAKRKLVSDIGPTETSDGRLNYDASLQHSPRRTSMSYAADPLSRQTAIRPPGHGDSDAIRFVYGNTGGSDPFHRFQSREDENGRRTTRYYDRYGRHISTFGDSAGFRTVTRFWYDAADQLVSTWAPKGEESTYEFDTIGNMTARHMPDQDDTTFFKYDAAGNLRFSQDPRQRSTGLVSYWVYDKYHRNIRAGEIVADFSDLQGLSSYGTYDFENDENSWVTKRYYDIDYTNSEDSFPLGHLTKVEENTDSDANPEVIVHLAVDRNGRIFKQDIAVDGLEGVTVKYSYDLAGKITRITYPDGSSVGYSYDSAARIDRITADHGQVIAQYLYGSNGLVDSLYFGDETAVGTFEYTLRDWTSAIRYPGVFEIQNDFDTVGNVRQQHYRHGETNAPYISNEYTYDGLDRLTGFAQNGVATRQWTYDMNGNSTSRTTGANTTHLSYGDESAPNRLTSISTTGDLVYDANGAIVDFEDMSLNRDYRGYISGYSDSDQMYKYTINSEGRRVKKQSQDPDGDTTYYIRGLNGSVLAEYNGNGAIRRSYVYGGSDRVAMIEDGTTSYYIRDHLGSTRAVLSEDGVVLASYDYWPYGQALSQTGDATQYLYTGHERDGESGLDYMLARMYSPSIGRFMRLDPKASALPHLSPYLYSSNNPLKFVDPDGELPHWAVGGVVGGLIGAGIEGYGQYSQGVFDGGAILGAATKGAITGAVAAATFGTSLLTQVGASSTAEVIGGVASREMSGEAAIDSRAIISDAIAGAVGGAAARGAEQIVQFPVIQSGIEAAKVAAKDLTSNAAAATFNRTGATAAKAVVERFGDAVFTQIDDVARKSAAAVRSATKNGANAASEIMQEENDSK